MEKDKVENYELNICGVSQYVKYVDGKYCDLNMGKWNEIDSEIFINDILTNQSKFQTILHEVCHVFFRYASLKDGDDEERIVQGMSVQLYNFIINNRDFIVDLINSSAKK